MKKIKELAFPLLIVLFILFINMNEISLPSTHAITNKMYKYTQKIHHHIYEMNDNKNTKTVYTLQTGSFIKVNDAQQQYILIMNSLNKKNLDYLRIEKVGDYYTVRLGKFKDNSTAKELVQVVKPHLSSVISLKAHIKDDRIIKLYDKEIL